MTSTDLTVKIFQEMRDDIRGLRQDMKDETRAIREEMKAGFEQVNVRFEQQNARFEVIETSLRDLAQQMVMLSRAIKVAIEGRAANDERLTDAERRIADLERRLGP